MKKKKLLKKVSLASLAVVMAAAGIFAFAPIGANATQFTTTTGFGLDPKNDPVVYTTESGLEIRMSNGLISNSIATTTNAGNTYTQDLSGIYYFTMGTYSGTIYTGENKSNTASYTVSKEPVNWIILGLGEQTGYFYDKISMYLFETWKNQNNEINYSNLTNGSYFFNKTYDEIGPAGQLIDSIVSAKTYIMDKTKASIGIHEEIPPGCMLVISEKILGQMYFNSTGNINKTLFPNSSQSYLLISMGGVYGNRYRYYGNHDIYIAGRQSWTINGNQGGSLYNYINNLFLKDNSTGAIINNSLGFSSQEANLIVPQQLYTFYSNGSGYPLAETPETDGGTYYSLFPLAYRAAHSSTKQNFCIEDYLPNENQRTASFIGSSTNQSYFWHLRSGNSTSNDMSHSVFPSGSLHSTGDITASLGVRPAMVMKLQ